MSGPFKICRTGGAIQLALINAGWRVIRIYNGWTLLGR